MDKRCVSLGILLAFFFTCILVVSSASLEAGAAGHVRNDQELNRVKRDPMEMELERQKRNDPTELKRYKRMKRE